MASFHHSRSSNTLPPLYEYTGWPSRSYISCELITDVGLQAVKAVLVYCPINASVNTFPTSRVDRANGGSSSHQNSANTYKEPQHLD